MEHELLAQAVDSLDVIAHEYRRKGKPSTVPRPGEIQVRRASSAAEIDAFFGEG